MRMILKGAAIALAVAGASFATTSSTNAGSYSVTTSHHGRDHRGTNVSFDFGTIAIGYRDGYWDNGHRWHKWRNRGDHDNYRSQYHDNYRDGYHHRYRHQGWRDR